MSIPNISAGWSNVVPVTVTQQGQVIPPVIRVSEQSLPSGNVYNVQWNDMTRSIVFQVSSDPNFKTIVASVSGTGQMRNGQPGLIVKTPPGTYWTRAAWQSTNIKA